MSLSSTQLQSVYTAHRTDLTALPPDTFTSAANRTVYSAGLYCTQSDHQDDDMIVTALSRFCHFKIYAIPSYFSQILPEVGLSFLYHPGVMLLLWEVIVNWLWSFYLTDWLYFPPPDCYIIGNISLFIVSPFAWLRSGGTDYTQFLFLCYFFIKPRDWGVGKMEIPPIFTFPLIQIVEYICYAFGK